MIWGLVRHFFIFDFHFVLSSTDNAKRYDVASCIDLSKLQVTVVARPVLRLRQSQFRLTLFVCFFDVRFLQGLRCIDRVASQFQSLFRLCGHCRICLSFHNVHSTLLSACFSFSPPRSLVTSVLCDSSRSASSINEMARLFAPTRQLLKVELGTEINSFG